MVRFILNFVLFGILFYAIYAAFPDIFFKMVSWANKFYDVLKDFFFMVSDKINEMIRPKGPQTPPPHQALFLLPLWILRTLKLK